jgi:hypothetical protein
VKKMKMLLVVLILGLLPACEDAASDSVVFLHTVDANGQVGKGSAVVTEHGVLVTACHMVKPFMRVYSQDGVDLEVGKFKCAGADFASAPIFNDAGVPGAKTGAFCGIKRMCQLGRYGNADEMHERCGLARSDGPWWKIVGGNTRHGMSGGGCFVDGVLVGVVSQGNAWMDQNWKDTSGVTWCSKMEFEK